MGSKEQAGCRWPHCIAHAAQAAWQWSCMSSARLIRMPPSHGSHACMSAMEAASRASLVNRPGTWASVSLCLQPVKYSAAQPPQEQCCRQQQPNCSSSQVDVVPSPPWLVKLVCLEVPAALRPACCLHDSCTRRRLSALVEVPGRGSLGVTQQGSTQKCGQELSLISASCFDVIESVFSSGLHARSCSMPGCSSSTLLHIARLLVHPQGWPCCCSARPGAPAAFSAGV